MYWNLLDDVYLAHLKWQVLNFKVGKWWIPAPKNTFRTREKAPLKEMLMNSFLKTTRKIKTKNLKTGKPSLKKCSEFFGEKKGNPAIPEKKRHEKTFLLLGSEENLGACSTTGTSTNSSCTVVTGTSTACSTTCQIQRYTTVPMGLVYLPTWMVDFLVNVGKYTIHG